MICDFSKSFIVAFVFLSIFLYFDSAYAETDSIDVKMIVFENTSIIEFTNNGIEPISVFKFWLNEDDSFLSFKSEYGWTSEQNNQGTLIFSSSVPVESGQKVKFGIKTNEANIPINWKAIGNDNHQLEINTILYPGGDDVIDKNVTEGGFLPNSKFKIIPESPGILSTVRISGSDFAANQNLHFFMNQYLIRSFETNDDGSFIFTETIPSLFEPGLITYYIKDIPGNEIQLKGHLEESIEGYRIEKKLSVDGLSERYSIGDDILFSGMVEPETRVFVKILDSSNLIWSENSTVSDKNGNWSLDFKISPLFSLGTYIAKTNALDYSVTQKFEVLLSKQIDISSLHKSYSEKDVISFDGTANPNEMIKRFVLNSNGRLIHSSESLVPENGLIQIKYDYDFFIPNETYFLYVFQGNAVDVLKFGIDKYPQKLLSSKMSKTNYFQDDVALIAIYGNPSELLDLTLVDDSGNSIFEDDITLGPDGKLAYSLDLTSLFPDYYSVIVSKGTIKTSENFTVDFSLGFHSLDYDFTKEFYVPNDLVVFRGTTNPQVPLNFTLIDPRYNALYKIESFSDGEGNFSIENFKIPFDATDGQWTIRTESGTNFQNTFLTVNSKDSFYIKVSDIQQNPYGTLVIFEGKNAAPKKIVNILIFHDNSLLGEINTKSTEKGDFYVVWQAPKATVNGEYMVKSQDANFRYSYTFFEI